MGAYLSGNLSREKGVWISRKIKRSNYRLHLSPKHFIFVFQRINETDS